MTDYDFSTLNDKEFEALCADLLSTVHGQHFERFKPGKDAGVDGRYFKADGSEVVLQCKHWQATPLERLVAHMVRVERPKLERLLPARYVLAVSHQLSRTDKARIRTILSPYVLRDDDILGRQDLNDILSRDPRIELRHYKLWIRSSTVLDHMINKAIHGRSAYSLEEIIQNAKLYVTTKLHPAAIERLEKLGTVIITGAPGIGKSTLAHQMVLHYANKGFKFVQIADDLREAESVYGDGEMQIFYFDDFLGRNYLEALSGHEGSHIAQFIRRVSHDKNKRFVLTSRTTILNQGKALIDVFSQNNIDRNELEIRIEALQEIDKARILYNHIWHSNLAKEYVDELYTQRRYRTIIAHRNFNPRLVRFITDVTSISDRKADQYWAYTKELLENPSQVWQHPFEAQLDDFGRAVVLLIVLNRRPLSQVDLSEAYSRFVACPESNGLTGRRDFLLTLRHLVGSLLSRSVTSASTSATATLDLFNPSIGDYVLHRYATDLPSLRAGFASLRSSSSIETLSGLVSNRLMQRKHAADVAEHVLREALADEFVGYTAEHVAATANCLLDNTRPQPHQVALIRGAVNFLLSTDPPLMLSKAAGVLEWAIDATDCDKDLAEEWALAACSNNPYPGEFEAIGRLLAALGDDAEERVSPALTAAKIEYVASNAHDEFDAGEVFSRSNPNDLHHARTTLAALAEKKLEEYGVKPTVSSIRTIVEAYDVYSQAESYFADCDSDTDRREYPSAEYADEIDDLFDRA